MCYMRHAVFCCAANDVYCIATTRRFETRKRFGFGHLTHRRTLMAIAHTYAAPHGLTARSQRKPGLLSRIRDALLESRMQAAEREIGSYLQTHGGRITDEAEREIERRFLSHTRW